MPNGKQSAHTRELFYAVGTLVALIGHQQREQARRTSKELNPAVLRDAFAVLCSVRSALQCSECEFEREKPGTTGFYESLSLPLLTPG